MGNYDAKIKSLNDFRNRIVAINFDYRAAKSKQESKLLQALRDLFKIPDEAEVELDYEVDGELCLSSNIRLNIHNVKEFPLIREEIHKSYNVNSFFSCVEWETVYQYYFKL